MPSWDTVQILIVIVSLRTFVEHASRGLLLLMLLSYSRHVIINASAAGTDSLGAVSSENKACSEIGIELLRRGVSLKCPKE